VALLHNEWHELAKEGQFNHSVVTSLKHKSHWWHKITSLIVHSHVVYFPLTKKLFRAGFKKDNFVARM
jgi:hypothetical protein